MRGPEFEVVRREDFLEIPDLETALEFLRRAEGLPSDSVPELAARIASGQLRVLRRHADVSVAPREEERKATAATLRTEKTWITLRILDEATAKPLPRIELHLLLPDGTEKVATTGPAGEIRLSGIDPGMCEAWCVFQGGTLRDTFHVAGTSEWKGAEADPAPGPRFLASILPYKVRSKDTLESVAGEFGLAPADLANFNWGGGDVDHAMRNIVGCTRRSDDGRFRFDDLDDPGILHIPRPWKVTNLATSREHAFHVRLYSHAPLLIDLDDGILGSLAELPVTLRYEDGSSETVTSDPEGVVPVRRDRGDFVDVDFGGKHAIAPMREILVPEDPSTRDGAWQSLINLGYVRQTKPPLVPPSDGALAKAVEGFQSHSELPPTGELDSETLESLRSMFDHYSPWGSDSWNVVTSETGEERLAKDEIG